MKYIICLLTLTFQYQLASCQKHSISFIEHDTLYGKLKEGLPRNDTIIELKIGDNISEKGAYAINKYGISNLKVGLWNTYFKNGNLKTRGNYKISSYIDCGMNGHFRSFYYYRTGKWKFYDQKGLLKYELIFEPIELLIDTNCGSDKLIFGLIDKIPLEYWGDLTSDEIYEFQKIKTQDAYYITSWIPLNGKIFIERIAK